MNVGKQNLIKFKDKQFSMVATVRDHRSADSCSDLIETRSHKRRTSPSLSVFIATSYLILSNYFSVFVCPIIFVTHLSAAPFVHVPCTG